MTIQSKKAKEIDAYIKLHGDSCKKGLQRIEIKGRIRFLESYMLPLKLLQYNHDNRRFNLEIQEYENQIGRPLDPTDKEDVKKIKELLLQDQIEAKKLKDDLRQLGEQREVAAITNDGVVVNGNRRMATMEELHIENPKGSWNELWIVRLPADISEKDLWKIEAGLQLSKEKVADYGPVNNLLMIKEGKKAGLSSAEIAASMYGWSEKQVMADLERLNLIDVFLQFMGDNNKNNYGLIKKFRLHEHFIDIQKGLIEKLKSKGEQSKDITKKLETVFLYLKGHIENPDSINITHYDVRNICKVLQDREATKALTFSFDKFGKNIKSVPVSTLVDNLDKAIDVKKNREDKEKPGKLIDKAITALNGIDRSGKHYRTDSEVKTKLKALEAIVSQMKKELKIYG